MTPGRFIAVVGPSGVGKDSIMAGLVARAPTLVLARRAITRPVDAGGEDFDSMTRPEFDAHVARGDFGLHWGAHGLLYGIPVTVAGILTTGCDVLANLSRSVLTTAATLFPDLFILSLTARPETLVARLQDRGREAATDIATRMTRAAPPFPPGIPAVSISNDGALADAVTAAYTALYPAVQQSYPHPEQGAGLPGSFGPMTRKRDP